MTRSAGFRFSAVFEADLMLVFMQLTINVVIRQQIQQLWTLLSTLDQSDSSFSCSFTKTVIERSGRADASNFDLRSHWIYVCTLNTPLVIKANTIKVPPPICHLCDRAKMRLVLSDSPFHNGSKRSVCPECPHKILVWFYFASLHWWQGRVHDEGASLGSAVAGLGFNWTPALQ